ncbi:MAG: hypothetical protein FJX65_10065 [Alphaproteobacteria bacterium]|nr:hypothetical protein [Alphaproteobacteria bacterium]
MAQDVRLPRRSKGPKPQFFRDPAMDHMMAMIIALTGELSVAIERQDTLERLLEARRVVPRQDIEAYRPDQTVEDQRFNRRDDLIARVFHVLHEQAELAEAMGTKGGLSYVADDRGAILGPSPERASRRKKAAKASSRSKARR